VGYSGAIWRVHPTRDLDRGGFLLSIRRRSPRGADAAFIAVPNHEAPAVAGALAARGAVDSYVSPRGSPKPAARRGAG